MASMLLQIDAFASRPFTGNPAAVALLDGPADPAWMQAVAAEMNLSETAFVHATGPTWALRWFTPTVEVELCGHATLATAHALWTTGRVATGDAITFDTRSGPLGATQQDDRIALTLPLDPATETEAADGLVDALGVDALRVGLADRKWVVEVTSADAVRACAPDLAALADHHVTVVTAPGDDADIVCRVFGPSVGIDEDPVTGSAQCTLVPWWQERLGKAELVTHQLSARGGELHARLVGEGVEVAGRAVTVLTGELHA